MIKAVAITLLCAAAVAGCTPTGSPEAATASAGRQCFYANSVDGFSTVDRDTINVEVSPSEVYQLDLQGPGCNEVDWAVGVSLQPRGGSFVCDAMDVDVVVPSSLGPQRCLVTSLRRLSADEVAAPR